MLDVRNHLGLGPVLHLQCTKQDRTSVPSGVLHRSRILALCLHPVLSSLQMHKAEMVMHNPVFPPPCCLSCLYLLCLPLPMVLLFTNLRVLSSLLQPSPIPFPAHGCFGEVAGRSQRLVLHTSPKLAMEITFLGPMRVSMPDSGTALKSWTHSSSRKM